MKHVLALFALTVFLTALAVAASSAEKEEVEERMGNFRGDRREKRQTPYGAAARGLPGPQGAPCTGRRCEPAEPGRIRGRVQEGLPGPFDRGFHAGYDAHDD